MGFCFLLTGLSKPLKAAIYPFRCGSEYYPRQKSKESKEEGFSKIEKIKAKTMG